MAFSTAGSIYVDYGKSSKPACLHTADDGVWYGQAAELNEARTVAE